MEFFTQFSLDSAVVNYQVLACMAIIWLAVVACTISSISKQGWTQRQRIFWLIVVTGIPLVGILLYLPFSFRIENYPHLKVLREKNR